MQPPQHARGADALELPQAVDGHEIECARMLAQPVPEAGIPAIAESRRPERMDRDRRRRLHREIGRTIGEHGHLDRMSHEAHQRRRLEHGGGGPAGARIQGVGDQEDADGRLA